MLLALTVWLPGSLALAQEPPPPPAPEEEEPGEVMIITDTRTEHRLSDATVATEVVTREEIAASGARDAGELLSTAAGLDVGGSFRGASAELRGLDPKYVLVLVDGQRVAGRSDGAVDLSRFLAADIEQIEVVKGPASALYGADALGGVINIRTRKPRSPVEMSLDLRGGSRALSGVAPGTDVPMDGLFPAMDQGLDQSDAEAALGLSRDRLKSRTTVGVRASSAYDLDPSDLDTSASAWREWSVNESGSVRLSDGASLGASGGYRRRETRGIDPGAGGATYDLINLVEDASGGLAPDLLLGASTRLQLSFRYNFYRDQFLQNQRLSDELDIYTDSRERVGEASAQLNHAWGDRNTTTGGVDGLFEGLESQRLSNTDASRARGAVFAQHEWTALRDQGVSRLVIQPGLRWDLDTQFGQHLSPKLAVRLDPVESVVLRASYGWGYRAPDFKELYLYFENPTAGYLVEGNPDLQPETSRSVDAGLTWQPTDTLRIGLSAWRNDVTNLIEPTLVADDPDETDGIAPYRNENVASARTEGVELSVSDRLADRLRLDAGYTFLHTRNLELDLPLEGRPPHRVTLECQGADLLAGLDGTVRAAWSAAQSYYADDDDDGVIELVEAPGFTSLGLRVGREIGRSYELYAGVDNLLDAGDATYNRLAPRLVYLGLRTVWPGREEG